MRLNPRTFMPIECWWHVISFWWTTCTVLAICILVRTELQVSAWEWASVSILVFLTLNLVPSFEFARFDLILIHVFGMEIVFFITLHYSSLFFDGNCTLRRWDHLYIYIQAWLLVLRDSVLSGSLKSSILTKCVCVCILSLHIRTKRVIKRYCPGCCVKPCSQMCLVHICEEPSI